jgi:peptide/nickel transport system permease protein
MARYVLKRLGLALITLLLLSVIVFATAQLLPGNVGRSVLGPYATEEAVAAYNHEHGTDRPAVVQYVDWLGGVVQGDLGQSLAQEGRSVWDILEPALVNSLKLALYAFLIVVPLGILGGVLAGLRVGKPTDRGITVVGLSVAVIPEFVTGLVLILVFSIWLDRLPVTAQWDEGAGVLTQIKHLTLPALALAIVLFGYIARITRAGVVEALDADYTRTAYLKGLPHKTVIRRHVLRNALMPTIAVVATQVGYLVGGLVAIEFLFNYRGIGLTVLEAAQQKDFTLLTAGVLVIGVTYLLVTLVAEAAARSEASIARRERAQALLRSPSFLIGAGVILFWIACAILGDLITPYDPRFDQTEDLSQAPSSEHFFGTDRLGRDVFSRVLAGSRDILLIAPAATLLATIFGTTLGLLTGYLRGIADDTISRVIDAVLAIPLLVLAVTVVAALGSRTAWAVTVVIAIVFTPIIARTVRAAVLGEAQLDYVEAARLRGERPHYVMFAEVLPNVMPPILVEATIRLGYAIFAVATLTFIGFGLQPPSPDWAVQIADNYQFLADSWWTVLFPAIAIASLVVAVNLVSDSVQQVLER